MKQINSIKFINSLAEITRYRDPKVIEHNLLKTLMEFDKKSSFHLYQVISLQPAIRLGLSAFASQDNIITTEVTRKQRFSEHFQQAIFDVVDKGEIVSLNQEHSHLQDQIIYPAFNAHNEIFAVLIQTSKHREEDERCLVHGLLQIYCNYLELIAVTNRDKLTGLLNRETLESEITRLLIKNSPPCTSSVPPHQHDKLDTRHYNGKQKDWLCVLDIDHFKDINDNYGHIYGDEILILVSRLLEQSVRDIDKVFRFGGEEFVLIVKASDQQDAQTAFERIRKVIESHRYAKIEKLTVSIGAKQITEENDPREVIIKADTALYYAKHHGRNQVHIYEDLLSAGEICEQAEEFEEGGLNFF
ncbi:GGDEF domain-containing protein [Psychromonas ossibalaenae]|uniref:GGDEF domain-containing protein n=1 Tax=Psychromonas ossibalaenae TaxID=444922 RepID=UPI00146F3FA9|nr:GGDEF domain-containing protein [Psychromonas ossibalaenae]